MTFHPELTKKLMSQHRALRMRVKILLVAAACGAAATLTAIGALGEDRVANTLSDLAAAMRATLALHARALGTGAVTQFTVADVPGDATLKVFTGTSYVDADALMNHEAATRWCFAERETAGTGFAPSIVLGHQRAGDAAVLLDNGAVTADEARELGTTPGAVTALLRRLCRFVG